MREAREGEKGELDRMINENLKSQATFHWY